MPFYLRNLIVCFILVKDFNPSMNCKRWKNHLKIPILSSYGKKDVSTLLLPKRGHPDVLKIIIHHFNITQCYLWFFRKTSQKSRQKKIKECFHQNCSFQIYLAASEDGNALETLRMNLEHNHEISRDIYESLLRQKPPTGYVLEEVKWAIWLKANNELLQ